MQRVRDKRGEQLAMAPWTLSVQLRELGKTEEAIGAIQESMAIYRTLLKQDQLISTHTWRKPSITLFYIFVCSSPWVKEDAGARSRNLSIFGIEMQLSSDELKYVHAVA